MKKFKFTIRGNQYDVEVNSFEDGIAKLEVNGTQYKVEVEKQAPATKTPILRRTPVKMPPNAHQIEKSEGRLFKVKAPLPGNILQLFVKAGDTVKKDDPLLLYEAMKMENKLLSEKEGTIQSVKVSSGDAVLQDDVLIELELN